MNYKLAWTQGFKRGFKKATRNNKPLQEKIFSVLDNLCKKPFDAKLKTHKLHGKLMDLWLARFNSEGQRSGFNWGLPCRV